MSRAPDPAARRPSGAGGGGTRGGREHTAGRVGGGSSSVSSSCPTSEASSREGGEKDEGFEADADGEVGARPEVRERLTRVALAAGRITAASTSMCGAARPGRGPTRGAPFDELDRTPRGAETAECPVGTFLPSNSLSEKSSSRSMLPRALPTLDSASTVRCRFGGCRPRGSALGAADRADEGDIRCIRSRPRFEPLAGGATGITGAAADAGTDAEASAEAAGFDLPANAAAAFRARSFISSCCFFMIAAMSTFSPADFAAPFFGIARIDCGTHGSARTPQSVVHR